MSDASVLQNSVYVGVHIQYILYGIELFLYVKTIRSLLINRGARNKTNLFYAFFSSIMLFLVSFSVASQAIFNEKMWLLDSDFPGGPDAYWEQNISSWPMVWAGLSVTALQLVTDGLMIHRCRIVWDSTRIIVIPVILWLANFALAIMVGWSLSLPGGTLASSFANVAIANSTISALLSIVLTYTICHRVVRHGQTVREGLGPEYASMYFAIVTVIVECVLPYTLNSITSLVLLGVGNQTWIAFAIVNVVIMGLAPQMLILRVVTGRAWNKNTFKRRGSTIGFGPAGTSGFDGARTHPQTFSGVYPSDGHGKV